MGEALGVESSGKCADREGGGGSRSPTMLNNTPLVIITIIFTCVEISRMRYKIKIGVSST